jgi:hypothetical protein
VFFIAVALSRRPLVDPRIDRLDAGSGGHLPKLQKVRSDHAYKRFL